jgi:hypothetical protein
MRTAWQSFPIEYKGGLITNMAPLQHGVSAPGSATVLQNFEPSIEGGYKKILGYSKWNEYPVPGEGLVTGVVITDTNNLIAVRESKYYTSVDREDWVERLDLSGDPGGKIRHTTFNFDGTTKVCMVDGVNKPVFWDSSDQSIYEDTDAPSDVEGAQRVITFKNHLFFSKGSNLIFTAPFDEEDYDSANGAGVINVGSRIVGMIVFREQLIVFSVSRIQRVIGNTGEDFALQPITMDTGAFCGDTIQEVGGDVLYLGPDGVRYLSATERIGDFALERASEQIQDKLVKFFAQCDNYASVVVRAKSQYRIFRYEETLPSNLSRGFLATRFRDQDSFGVAWSELVGFKLYNSDSKLFRDKEIVVFCNESDYIYEMESGNSFDGGAIECIFETPPIPIEDPRIRKTYYKHTLYLKPDGAFNINVNLLFDYNQIGVLQPPTTVFTSDGSLSSFWGQSKWGEFSWTGELQRVYPSNTIGSSFVVALRFYQKNSAPSFKLDSSILEFTFNDRK